MIRNLAAAFGGVYDAYNEFVWHNWSYLILKWTDDVIEWDADGYRHVDKREMFTEIKRAIKEVGRVGLRIASLIDCIKLPLFLQDLVKWLVHSRWCLETCTWRELLLLLERCHPIMPKTACAD